MEVKIPRLLAEKALQYDGIPAFFRLRPRKILLLTKLLCILKRTNFLLECAEKCRHTGVFQTLRVHYSGKLVVLRLLSPFEVDFKMGGVHQPRLLLPS